MKQLTREHCANVIVGWGNYYVKRAQKDLDSANGILSQTMSSLSSARLEEKIRDEYDPDRHCGFGVPTPDQIYAEAVARDELRVKEAVRVLLNNLDMLDYINSVVASDIPHPIP